MLCSGFIYFGVLTIFLQNTLALSDDQKYHINTKFIEVGEECIKDHPISAEDLESFGSHVFPDHDNTSCFAACVFNKVGFFDDNGALAEVTALDNARKIFEDEDELKSIQQFFQTCAKVNDKEVSDGEKGCERAKLAFNCHADNLDTIEFDISFV